MVIDKQHIDFDYIYEYLKPHSHKADCWVVNYFFECLVNIGIIESFSRHKRHGTYHFSIYYDGDPSGVNDTINYIIAILVDLKIMTDRLPPNNVDVSIESKPRVSIGHKYGR